MKNLPLEKKGKVKKKKGEKTLRADSTPQPLVKEAKKEK
jgi:hypothetical protein